MWKLYDALIDGIGDGPGPEKILTGERWTLALRGKDTGMAMTTPLESRSSLPGPLTGLSLKQAAQQIKSWNFTRASEAMAVINAYYNSEERRSSLHAAQYSDDFCARDLNLGGKTVALIGHLRVPEKDLAPAREVYILERCPRQGDYPDSACEYLLPRCDVVFITGSALINKTMPRLLQLCRGAVSVLIGPTVPLAPALLEAGAHILSGLVVSHREEMIAFTLDPAISKGSPYRYGKRFWLENRNGRSGGEEE